MRAGLAAARRARGFSIIELLVAIIIIGILVAVLIPVVSSRTEQARVARVQSDIEGITESLERVAIDTGYYVRLFALNDVLLGDDLGFGSTNDRYDGITDYRTSVSNAYINFPNATNSLFIDTKTGLYGSVNRDELISRMIAAETSYDSTLSWNGPYVNWQKDTNRLGFVGLTKDSLPDDPWGNNYILFTRAGMVLEPDGTIEADISQDSTTGIFSVGGEYDCQVFDRPTVLSLGRNGLPGDGSTLPQNSTPGDVAGGDFGDSDDYYRQFGR